MERVFDVLNRLSAAGSATSYDEEAMKLGDVLWDAMGVSWHSLACRFLGSSYRKHHSCFKVILGFDLRVRHDWMLDLFQKLLDASGK